MARKLRIQYPGAIYHVMNRGDRREAIFEDDKDRERLLETLTEACAKTGWQAGKADGLERGRPKSAAEGRAEEGGFSLGVAFSDDDAAGLDCGAAEHGHPRSSGVVVAATRRQPAFSPRRSRPAGNMNFIN